MAISETEDLKSQYKRFIGGTIPSIPVTRELRLPRTILGVLAIAVTAMQGILRNTLASPFTLILKRIREFW